MALEATPGFDLQPSAKQVPLKTNYISDFDFLNQYLPDTYEREFSKYGNRTLSGFLRTTGAEMPFQSDLIKWTEEGRLHIKYTDLSTPASAAADTATFTVNDAAVTGTIAIRKGQTVMLYDNAGTGGSGKAIVTDVDYTAGTFDVAFYEAGGLFVAGSGNTFSVFIYGSEFKKGTNGMEESVEAETNFLDNTPIILKDKYAVSGSDMAQIGWVKVDTDNGAGYLWFMKSKHDARLRFDDYLETSMIEAVPAEAGSGAIAATGDVGNKGSKGLFYEIDNRGNIWSAGNPDTLAEWDTVVGRLDKQGAIEENTLFVDRDMSFAIDDMLAAQNNFGSSGASFGVFENDRDMALNLGFTGFRRGYDFYKTEWKYLNDPTARGGMSNTVGSGKVNGVLVPCGSKNVYDEVLGQNATRPYLHVRYRESKAENRKYKTWLTGSAGGASNSDLDAMEMHFLSERALCTLGANNFMKFNA